MSERPTCGVLYQRALEHFTGMDPEKIRLAAEGFFLGQAEKCYLGACKAAMFRPSPEWADMTREALDFLVTLYTGLDWREIGSEFWLYRLNGSTLDNVEWLESMLRDGLENTALWHEVRADLCGIPQDQVDRHFHERPGYDEPADRAPSATEGIASDAMAIVPFRCGQQVTICCGRCARDLNHTPMRIHEGVALCPACDEEVRGPTHPI